MLPHPFVILMLGLAAQTGSEPPPPAEPENERLPIKEFHRGLKQLGLNDLLESHVREFPPEDPVDAAMLRRELRLNLYNDPSVDVAERLQAAEEAMAVLRDLLAEFPEHPRRFEWALSLGRDLVERQAEPYVNNILFRGGSSADRQALAEITSEALAIYQQLLRDLQREIARIDEMSIPEFEAAVQSGVIDSQESILPKARYFMQWASYYHCLTLPPGDPQRVHRLNEIIDYLTTESDLVNIEHRYSHYQAQSMLLAGMAYRLLGIYDRAENMLAGASSLAASLPSYTERHNLRWVVTLAELERVKSLRDTGDHAGALEGLQRFRDDLPPSGPGSFGLKFALALLEGTILRKQAGELDAADVAGRQALLLRSRQALIDLARAHPAHQDEIYATLFDMIGAHGEVPNLDPFEKHVYIAGLLRQVKEQKLLESSADAEQARRAASEKQALLERAVAMAAELLADASPLAQALRPEIQFNLAVCRLEQGKPLEAIEGFALLVEQFPEFEKSRLAADTGVRLAEGLYAAASEAQRTALRSIFERSLRALIEHFPRTPEARRRRYTLGRVLEEQRKWSEAETQYADVPPEDPHYAEALLRIAQCHLQILRGLADGEESGRIGAHVQLTLNALKRFQQHAASSEGDSVLAVEAQLIAAEVHLLAEPPKPEEAVAVLEGFGQGVAGDPRLMGRAMRLRLLAYQQLGQWERAEAILPQYVQQDPRNAGPTLQGLLDTFKHEIQSAEERGDSAEVQQRARDALAVARQLDAWSAQAGLAPDDRLAFRLELGDALLRVQQESANAEARTLYQEVVDSLRQRGAAIDGRALLGLAEATYRLADYEQALELFHDLYERSPDNNPVWWEAFMREIECRLALAQDPEILYKLMEQKKAFYPKLGGPAVKGRFTALEEHIEAKLP